MAVTATIPSRLAQALAERIVDGRIAPGERLIEAQLAAEFGTSHGPVRDALRVLERAGLVEIAAYRGASVRGLSIKEVTELYQVRAALVGLRARWLAEDATGRAFADRHGEAVRELAQLARASDDRAYSDAALELNRAFTDSVANPWLRGMLESLSLQTARYTRLVLADAQRRRASARAWSALLAAIRLGDGDRAERLARANSLATRDASVRALIRRDRLPVP